MSCALAGALNGRIQGDCIAHIFTVNRVTAAGPDCTAASLCCVCALAPVCDRVCVCMCVCVELWTDVLSAGRERGKT